MKKRRLILSMLLSAVILLVITAGISLTAFAQTGDDYEYNLLKNGKAEITGYNGDAATLTIPKTIDGNTVISIKSNAFKNSGIMNLTIPESISSIERNAFIGCNNLIRVSILNPAVADIEAAFPGFFKRTDKVLCYGYYHSTFHSAAEKNGCEFIILAEPSKQIDFSYRVLDDGTAEIMEYNGTSRKVIIPSKINGLSVSSIGPYAFYSYRNHLTGVVIPEGVKEIGWYAFSGCIGLTEIELPASITTIGVQAFSETGLTEINIPNGVKEIGAYAFFGCSNLKIVRIPASVTSIGKETKFNLPGIRTDGLYTGNPFASCYNILRITVNDKNPVFDSRENCNAIVETKSNTLLQGCKNTTIPYGITEIGEFAFADCDSLTEIKIPDSVTKIGDSAFENSALLKIKIPDSVTYIGNAAFSGCYGLKKVNIPQSVSYIGTSAFESCYDEFSGEYLETVIINNKNCMIDICVFDDLTAIHGYKNSTAQKYAEFYGNEFVVIDKLAAPKASFAVNSNKTLTISWNAVPGADKYEVYFSNDGGNTYRLTRTTAETAVTTGTAAFGTIYKYKIKAIDSSDNIKSDFSNVVNAVNDKYLPAPSVTYAVNADRTFTISWNKVTGADKYEIYSSSDGGKTYKYVKTTTELFHKTGKAAFGTTYKYKIRAVNSAKNVKSGYCTVSAINKQYLPATTAKYAVNSDCTLTISWAKVTGADKYEIYSYNASTGTYKYVKTTTELSYKTGRASYGVTYKYKIRAVNSANNIKSGYCTVNAVNNKKLTTPTAKLAVNTNGSFTISWGKVTGATKYEVYIYDSAKQQYRLSRTSTGTSITTGTASKGVTYYYKVRAVTSKNTSATSDFSAVVKGKR